VEMQIKASCPQKMARKQSFKHSEHIALQDTITIEQQHITKQGNINNWLIAEKKKKKDKDT